jgi:ABC-type Fe3+ transport system substrate-binding protein
MNKKNYSNLIKLIPILILILILFLPFILKNLIPVHEKKLLEFAKDSKKKIIILSPHRRDIRYEYQFGFEKWIRKNYRIKASIEWYDAGGTSKVEKYIYSSYKNNPEGIGIDILWGGGVSPYIALKSQGLLMKYKLPNKYLKPLEKYQKTLGLYDHDYYWYGTALAGFGIIYNKEVLDKLNISAPVTWFDLADIKYFKLVAAGDPRSSGSVHAAYDVMLQALGWEKGFSVITMLGGNASSFGEGGGYSPREVAIGEAAVGISIDSYAWAHIRYLKDRRLRFLLPENTTLVNPDAIGILKGAPHYKLSCLFIKYTLSEEGQRLLLLPAGSEGGPVNDSLDRICVNYTVYEKYKHLSTVQADPFKFNYAFNYSFETDAKRRTVVRDIIGISIIDNHALLQKAWKAVIDSGKIDSMKDDLSKMPITSEEALQFAEKWSDQEFRLKKMKEWNEFFIRKYNEIIKTANSSGKLSFAPTGF